MSLGKSSVILAIFFVISMTFVFADTPCQAEGNTVTLWGKQIAGSGHAKNATQDGNTVEVKNSAEILKVTGTAKSYCIWKVGGYRGYLCGGAKQDSIVGKELPKGKYIVRAGLSDHQSQAEVRIELKLK